MTAVHERDFVHRMASLAGGVAAVRSAVALRRGGLPVVGGTPAFVISEVALSLPEMIIARKVPTLRPIALFVAIAATGILAVFFESTPCSEPT